MDSTTPTTSDSPIPTCWYCGRPGEKQCRCTRGYCGHHGLAHRCMLCALSHGMYHEQDRPTFVSDLIMLSVVAVSGDPYIVVPPRLQGTPRLPMQGVERLIGGLAQVVAAPSADVRQRVAETMSRLLVSWPTMDPSQLNRQQYGTGLISVEGVRHTLLSLLNESRGGPGEPLSLAILEGLCNADFRELYPQVAENLPHLRISRQSASVQETVKTVGGIYPTRSYAVNERCELFFYEQYVDRKCGAGDMMERMYGPKLRYAPALNRMLKKGVWLADFPRFHDWFPGENEPY